MTKYHVELENYKGTIVEIDSLDKELMLKLEEVIENVFKEHEEEIYG